MADESTAKTKKKKKNKLVEKVKKALGGLVDDLHEPDKAIGRVTRKTSRLLMAAGQKFIDAGTGLAVFARQLRWVLECFCGQQ